MSLSPQPWDRAAAKVAMTLGHYEPLPSVTGYIEEACRAFAQQQLPSVEGIRNVTVKIEGATCVLSGELDCWLVQAEDIRSFLEERAREQTGRGLVLLAVKKE